MSKSNAMGGGATRKYLFLKPIKNTSKIRSLYDEQLKCKYATIRSFCIAFLQLPNHETLRSPADFDPHHGIVISNMECSGLPLDTQGILLYTPTENKEFITPFMF
jgi:hypothetical protein